MSAVSTVKDWIKKKALADLKDAKPQGPQKPKATNKKTARHKVLRPVRNKIRRSPGNVVNAAELQRILEKRRDRQKAI